MNQTFAGYAEPPDPEMEKLNATYPQSKREEEQAARRTDMRTKSSVFNMSKNPRTPNVFTTSPRPGGYLRTLVSPNRVDQTHINTALEIIYNPPKPTDQSMLFDAFKHLNDKEQEARQENEAADDISFDVEAKSGKPAESEMWTSYQDNTEDCNFVLSVVISTLMALAGSGNGNRIPPHHVMWTVNFLSTIKDDDQRTPTNLVGIKKMLRPLIENLPETSELLDDFATDETMDRSQLDRTPRFDAAKRPQGGPLPKRGTLRPSRGLVTSTPVAAPRTKRMTSGTSVDSTGRTTPRKSSWK